MSEIKFRDIKLGDMVSIEMPAHAWIGFMHWYSAIDEPSGVANEIWKACQAALVDPVFLRETLAAQQQEIDIHNATVHQIIQGGTAEITTDMMGIVSPLDFLRMQQENKDNENGDQTEE
jgi:hypothetical protein